MLKRFENGEVKIEDVRDLERVCRMMKDVVKVGEAGFKIGAIGVGGVGVLMGGGNGGGVNRGGIERHRIKYLSKGDVDE